MRKKKMVLLSTRVTFNILVLITTSFTSRRNGPKMKFQLCVCVFTASHCPQFKASEDSLICLTEYPSEVLVVSANVFTNTEQELTNSFTSIGKLWGDLHKTPLIYTHPNQSLVHACNQLSFPHKHVESGVSVIAEDP